MTEIRTMNSIIMFTTDSDSYKKWTTALSGDGTLEVLGLTWMIINISFNAPFSVKAEIKLKEGEIGLD